MPRDETPQSRGGPASGIRRHVTVLFSDLCASTFLGHFRDPEILAEVMYQVNAAADRVVRRHGGVVNQVHGDGVVAVFGLPSPHEDDVRRAAEAALDLHEVVRNIIVDSVDAASFAPRLHSGIHSGLVVAGKGDLVLGRYELVGDAVNTAAGLCAGAEPDEVVVSEPTFRSALPFFATEPLDPISVKGRPEPVPALRIVGRSQVATRFEARAQLGLTPFVGRDFELRRLEELLREARRGRLQIAQLVADAGVGKTRVANEFIRRAESTDCAVHRGYCESYGRVAPLQPFLIMLRQYFEITPEMSAEAAAGKLLSRLTRLRLQAHAPAFLRMLSLTSAEGAPAAEGPPPVGTTVETLTAFVVALAGFRPLVLFFDDWQWSDDASRQVLDRLIRAVRDECLLVLVASRSIDPVDPSTESAETLSLEPFSRDESTRTIEALLPEPINLGVAARIHERSGGNVLFIEELCQAPVWSTPDGTNRAAREVPATLHGLIEARVERLPTEEAELVRAAAVIGNVIPTWLLEVITGHRKGDDILDRLAGQNLIYAGESEGTLRFKHGITRDVIYDSVGLRKRRSLHREIAEALEARARSEGVEDLYESLAYHHAGAAQPARLVHFAELAGDKALAASTLDRAREQYAAAMRALDSVDPSPGSRAQWISICKRWALACVYSPSRDQLEILARAAEYARELGDLDGLAHAHHWMGFIHYALGDQQDSIAHFEQALPIARELSNSRLVAQLLSTLGQSLAAACKYPEALARLGEALDRKREQSQSRDSAPPMGSAYALACKAFILGDLGHFEEADATFQSGLDALRGTNEATRGSILALRAVASIWQGRFAHCIEVATEAGATAARVNGPYVFGISRCEAAYARWMLEGDRASLDSLRQSTEWLVAQDMCLYISLCYGWLADAMTTAGESRVAREYADRALLRAKERDRVGEGMACRALARLAAAGEPGLEPPERYLERAIESGRDRGSRREEAVSHLGLAQLHLSRGREREGLELAATARQELLAMDMHWHAAEAERLGRRQQH